MYLYNNNYTKVLRDISEWYSDIGKSLEYFTHDRTII